MKHPRIAAVAVVTLAGGGVLATALPASAHHTNLACAGPGLVAVNNSEPIPMTFDSNQGDDDVPIGPNGTVNIVYDGGDLVITSLWSNGVTHTTSPAFNEDCGPTDTTEPPVETTEPDTTVVETTEPETTVVETTEPETTVVETTEPETTVVETTEPEETTSTTTIPDPTTTTTTVPPTSTSTTVPASSTTVPVTTVVVTTTPTPEPPCEDDPSTPADECAPACDPVLVDLNGDGDTLDPNESSCSTGRLPATR